jgi:hypothetical protein
MYSRIIEVSGCLAPHCTAFPFSSFPSYFRKGCVIEAPGSHDCMITLSSTILFSVWNSFRDWRVRGVSQERLPRGDSSAVGILVSQAVGPTVQPTRARPMNGRLLLSSP